MRLRVNLSLPMLMSVTICVRDVVDQRLRLSLRHRRVAVALVALAGLGGSATASFGARYTVRPGDTLSAIARRAGTSVSALLEANHLADANRIFAGETLSMGSPPPSGGSNAGAPGASGNGAGGYPLQLQRHPERLALLPSLRHWAAVSGVPANLLEALTWMESGWQNGVVSSTGAIGIGQLEPSTVRFVTSGLLGIRLDPHRPDDNIRMTAAYLAWLLRQTGGRIDIALGGYYQGIGSVGRRGLMPETRRYITVIGLLRPAFSGG